MKFGIDWLRCFREKMFDNYGYIHVYSPGTGGDNPLRSIFFFNSIIQSIVSFAVSFSSFNDFVTVFPIQSYKRPNLTLP